MKIPSFVWIILVLVVGFGFLALLVNNKNAQTVTSATLPVMVDVYVDFNCPHCAEFEPSLKAAREKYGDDVNIQLKNLPFLTSGQSKDSSVDYALAQIAARKQDMGNEYAEELFKWITYLKAPSNTVFSYTDEQKELYRNAVDVDALAESLGLNVEKFMADRISAEVTAEMKAEKESAIKVLGAPSTPSVFFYGKPFRMNTYDEFDTQINNYIQAAKTTENAE